MNLSNEMKALNKLVASNNRAMAFHFNGRVRAIADDLRRTLVGMGIQLPQRRPSFLRRLLGLKLRPN